MQYSCCRLGTTLTMCDWRLPRSIEDSNREFRPCRSLVGKIPTVSGPTAPLTSPAKSLSRARLPLSSLKLTLPRHLTSADSNGLTRSLTTFKLKTYARLGDGGPLSAPIHNSVVTSPIFRIFFQGGYPDKDSRPACPVPDGEQACLRSLPAACPRQGGQAGQAQGVERPPHSRSRELFVQWSYLYTGILPRLKSFVCHSYENCRGVGVFFPIRNASSRRFNVQTFRRAAESVLPILLCIPYASSGRAIVPRPVVHSTYQIHARIRP
jgi:hypothetical protein